MENDKNTGKRTGQLIGGIIVLGIGILAAAERISGFYVPDFYRLWPLILVAIGIVKLARRDKDCDRSSGFFLILLGGWFLLNTLRVYGLDWGESWPIFLILLGVHNLIFPRDEGGRTGGVILLAVGTWSFINVFEIGGFYWDNSWSLAIIAVGLVIVWGALFANPKRASIKKEDSTHG